MYDDTNCSINFIAVFLCGYLFVLFKQIVIYVIQTSPYRHDLFAIEENLY